LPTPDDAKSAKKARTSSYKPVSSSSSEKKQKDKIHLTKPSASDSAAVTINSNQPLVTMQSLHLLHLLKQIIKTLQNQHQLHHHHRHHLYHLHHLYHPLHHL